MRLCLPPQLPMCPVFGALAAELSGWQAALLHHRGLRPARTGFLAPLGLRWQKSPGAAQPMRAHFAPRAQAKASDEDQPRSHQQHATRQRFAHPTHNEDCTPALPGLASNANRDRSSATAPKDCPTRTTPHAATTRKPRPASPTRPSEPSGPTTAKVRRLGASPAKPRPLRGLCCGQGASARGAAGASQGAWNRVKPVRRRI